MRDITATRPLPLALIGLVCILPAAGAAQSIPATPVYITTATPDRLTDDKLADSVKDIVGAVSSAGGIRSTSRGGARLSIVVSERRNGSDAPITFTWPGETTNTLLPSKQYMFSRDRSIVSAWLVDTRTGTAIAHLAGHGSTWRGAAREVVTLAQQAVDANRAVLSLSREDWLAAKADLTKSTPTQTQPSAARRAGPTPISVTTTAPDEFIDVTLDDSVRDITAAVRDTVGLSLAPPDQGRGTDTSRPRPSEQYPRQDLSLANALQAGMSRDHVLATMGEPVLREFRGSIDEWHYCSTNTAPVGSTPVDSFVAVFFRDKELVEMSRYTVTLEDTNGATGSCDLFAKRGSYRLPAWAMQPE